MSKRLERTAGKLLHAGPRLSEHGTIRADRTVRDGVS